MPANSGSKDGLASYRSKRYAGRTPEPFGSAAAPTAAPPLTGRARFVVQKHAARPDHCDFRLEMDGVLVSWALPRGPSLDPNEKRKAVLVENHPLEYADFEGIIPEGSYGAGAVIVWDRGSWQVIEDPAHGMDKGKLLFDLHGHKLRGRWTLVRTKRSAGARSRDASGERAAEDAPEWLLIKKPDGFADPSGEHPPGEGSVLSGLTLDELAGGAGRFEEVRAAVVAAGAPLRPVDPASLRLMLCESREHPFSGDGWLFEIKHDGFRLIAGLRECRAFLRYRGGRDTTAVYPEIDLALRSLPFRSLVLDGEVVVCDAAGRPDFGRLQTRAMLQRPRDIARAALTHPATYMVFDLLAFDGHDLRCLPLWRRKELLRRILPAAGVLRYVEHIPTRGEDFYRGALELGLEGMVGKRADSPYRAGRSPLWLKVRSMLVDDFAVVGYSPPGGRSRVGFGGLHLAVREGERWVYAGKVGGGFSDAELEEIRRVLDESPRVRYDFDVPGASSSVWVEPRLVVEVRYREWSAAHFLRQPVFIRMRDDKAPEECESAAGTRRGEEPAEIDAEAPDPADPAAAGDATAGGSRTVAVTNRDKLFWPEGHTKGDLLDYYDAVAPWLLPYLADRPLVLTRFPDGIEGKSFYQKDAPAPAPGWVRTESVWSEQTQRAIRYFVCEDAESLRYVVNMGTIPLHVWSSCVSRLSHPDWCILDLDPKGAPFTDVVDCALAIRRLCDEIELPSFVKTSGSTGLHILVPLGRQCTYEQSRSLAGLIARIVEAELPAVSTMARVIDARGGKVYLDWLQNRHGQLLVAPFSARPLPGAPVSMPLLWSEVTRRLDHTRFTIASARRRLDRVGDPLRPVLEARPDLLAALARLGERLARTGTPAPRGSRRPRKVR